MIRYATVIDIPEIKKIWDQSFEDPLSYVDFLYDKVMTPSDTIVYEEDGQIYSMAMSIYCSFRYHDDVIPCVYVYGCATLPDRSGRGIIESIIRYLGKIICEHDLFTKPVNKSSESFGQLIKRLLPFNDFTLYLLITNNWAGNQLRKQRNI